VVVSVAAVAVLVVTVVLKLVERLDSVVVPQESPGERAAVRQL
jgi:hypothetical protein